MKRGLRLAVVMMIMVLVALGCDSTGAGGGGDDTDAGPYTVSGTVTEDGAADIEAVDITFSGGYSPVTTNANGEWSKSGLTGTVTVTPVKDGWTFAPASAGVAGPSDSVDFTGTESGITFAGGDGSVDNPYQVVTAAQLNEIRNHLHDHFVQTADIDLIDYAADGWLPIGPTFEGSFDGDVYTISGLFIDRIGEKTGLFAESESWGVIRNVTLSGVDVTADGDDVGALVGFNRGTIENCTVDGTVTQTSGLQTGGLVGVNTSSGTISDSTANVSVSGNRQSGGLVGRNAGTIERSSAAGEVTGGLNETGGLVGRNTGTISDSFATGPVTGENSVGGLVGSNNGGDIMDSSASGLVTGTAYAIGGLVGDSFYENSRIRRSYATGDVVATGTTDHVGGLIGDNGSEVEDSYATGDVTGRNSVGGFVGLNQSDGAILRCYSYGKATASGSTPGGFAGQSSGTIAASYWDTEASDIEVSDGGEGRTTAQMQAGTPGASINPDGTVDGDLEPNNLMYDGWASAVWNFGAATDYPVLQWQ